MEASTTTAPLSPSDRDEEPSPLSSTQTNVPLQQRILKVLYYLLIVFGGGTLLYVVASKLYRLLFGRRGRSSSGRRSRSSFIEDLFASPFMDDDEELRLRPVAVNTYCYILPTHVNKDGIFVKLLLENTSELATENV